MGSLAYTRLTERNGPPATRRSLAPRRARARCEVRGRATWSHL